MGKLKDNLDREFFEIPKEHIKNPSETPPTAVEPTATGGKFITKQSLC